MITIGRDKTSDELIERFVSESLDENPIHKSYGGRVLPGLYYLKLIEPYIDKPISSVKMDFKGFAFFPIELRLDINESKYGRSDLFVFSQNGEQKSSVEVFYNGANIDNNSVKLQAVYRVGGELYQKFCGNGFDSENQRVLYVGQIMQFDKYYSGSCLINIGEPKKLSKRDYIVETNYENSWGNVVGFGEASTMVIGKKTFDKLMALAKNKHVTYIK